jgi:uncharacterized protein DUF4268
MRRGVLRGRTDMTGSVPDSEVAGKRVDSKDLGRIEWLEPRIAWINEALDFTPWLKDNVDLLGHALGLELDVEVEREVRVGSFSADLVGTDAATGRHVLIENQLAQTDHGHLGQLLTYAGGLETDILVWVAPRIREEHRQALIWLNENTREETAFFGVEIQLLKIDDSRPAAHFKVVVEPNEWQKAVAGGPDKGPSERNERYRAFWKKLLTELLSRDPTSSNASIDRVPAQNWYGISLGRSGYQDNFVFGWDPRGNTVRVELYIDTGDRTRNKASFDQLLAERDAIEQQIGEPLSWDRRDDIRACRIHISRPGSIDDLGLLDEYCTWGAERMLRLRDVFGPRVRALDFELT